uniref:THIF-type NAD/FAD binding fold domain-containing protein n=1 Tax=Leersia perrieri TaxID=77586 RepID=A0A0D9XN80_9ORYZ
MLTADRHRREERSRFDSTNNESKASPWLRPPRDLDLTRRLSPADYGLVLALTVAVGLLGGALHYMLTRKREEELAGDDLQKKTRADANHNHSAMTTGRAPEIDEDLHSRQLAVYGRETMKRLFGSNVLVSGLNGLGAEIAKNLVLAGVKSVTLHDDNNVDLWDLSSNFFLSEKDVGQNRAQACIQKLQELNNAVIISTITGDLSKEHLSNFQVCEQAYVYVFKSLSNYRPRSNNSKNVGKFGLGLEIFATICRMSGNSL